LWGLGLMMLAKAIVVVDEDVDVQDVEAIAKEVMNNVYWRRDVTLIDGAVDQLDHSAMMDSYGGKIGIDATRSTREEFMTPPTPPAPIPAEQVTALVGDKWTEKFQTIFIALDKSKLKTHDAMRKLWEICPEYNIVVLDHNVNLNNLSDVAWRILGNVDWRRDIEILGAPINPYDTKPNQSRGQIGIDATSKYAEDGHPRGWPEELFMSPEIVERVNQRWAEYGLK
jgi:4-hydroxy-3-polyprenylbenzoate decarboxylase